MDSAKQFLEDIKNLILDSVDEVFENDEDMIDEDINEEDDESEKARAEEFFKEDDNEQQVDEGNKVTAYLLFMSEDELNEKTTHSSGQVKKCNIQYDKSIDTSIFTGIKKYMSPDIIKLNRDFNRSKIRKYLDSYAEGPWEIDVQEAMIIFAEHNGWTINNIDKVTNGWRSDWRKDAEKIYSLMLSEDELDDEPIDEGDTSTMEGNDPLFMEYFGHA